MAIKDAVDQLRADIAAAADRVISSLNELDTLRADRDRLQRELDDLRAAEAAEDVDQDAALAAKQAEVDAKAAEIAEAEAGLRSASEDVARIAAPATEPGPGEIVPDGERTEDAAAVQTGDEEPPLPPQFV